jgi:putative DNA primase/helicase
LIILDNLSSLVSGVPENTKEDWDGINQLLLSLRFMGLAVLMVHHAGKSGDQRGISSREDNLDITIKLTRPAGYRPQDGASFEVEFTKARGVFGECANSFNMRFINNGKNGLIWTTDEPGSGSRETIIALLGHGISQKDIPALLNCGKAWVSRVKAKAIREELLTKNGAFTPKGKLEFGKVDIGEFT